MSSLMRWDPFEGLVQLQRDMDRLFNSLFGRSMAQRESEEEDGVRIPPIDLAETEQEVIVKAELPGVAKDQVELEVMPERLWVSAEIKREDERGKATVHCQERAGGRFERSISLPAEVITDQVKASLENGILEVHLPKTDRARAATPKKVTVE